MDVGDTQNFGLAKTDRLLKPADFSEVFGNTRLKVHTDHLIALIRLGALALDLNDDQPILTQNNQPNHSLPRVRLGLAVSKKKLKKAVDRNRLKRLIREQHRLQKHRLQSALTQHSLSELDLVLVCKRTPADMQLALHDEVGELFDKITRKINQLSQPRQPAALKPNQSKKNR